MNVHEQMVKWFNKYLAIHKCLAILLSSAYKMLIKTAILNEYIHLSFINTLFLA